MEFALHQQEILNYMEKNSDELVSFEDYEDLSPEEKLEIEKELYREKQIEAGVAQKISVMSYQMRFWNRLESHQIRQQESRIVRSLPDREMEQQHSKPANHRECRHFQMICFV